MEIRKSQTEELDLGDNVSEDAAERIRHYIDRSDGRSDLYMSLPGGAKARHTCELCHRKRYEDQMRTSGFFKRNNFKHWLLWQCKQCADSRESKEVQQ